MASMTMHTYRFFPFVLVCQQLYELMVAQGEGRSPMTSSDAETDSKFIIIIFYYYMVVYD